MWDFKKFGNKKSFIDEYGSTLTYAELEHENKNLSKFVERRCVVFSLCSNTIGSVVGYTSFMTNDIVPVLLNSNYDDELLNKLIDCYYPAFIWLPKNLTEKYSFYEKVYEKFDYVLLKTGFKKKYPLHESLALLLTTSGSTGSPKFVRQTYTNVMTNANQIAEYLELDASEKPITTLPMSYTYGCSIINSHLLVGATILLTDKTLMDREFWSFFKEQKATSFGGVPYTYEILEKLRFFRMDLPDLKYMTQAGGKLSPELHRKFAEFAMEKGKKFIVMYGACEATARMGYLPADKSLEKYGSCGIAIPQGKFYLIDADGKVIEKPEQVGELVYEGANVTMGYADCGTDLIKGDEWKGRLQTGDMAKRDKDGFYYIVGRKKRFLKIFGNRVNLDEVDRLIKAQFNFIECASAGIDDHMYIFVTEESIVEDVRKFISEKTKLNATAFKVIKIDEIPKNDAGKTLYKELVNYYEQ